MGHQSHVWGVDGDGGGVLACNVANSGSTKTLSSEQESSEPHHLVQRRVRTGDALASEGEARGQNPHMLRRSEDDLSMFYHK